MGSQTDRKSNPTKARSSSNKHVRVKHAARRNHQKWSKDRSERVRDALNRDADLLYNILENTSTMQSTISETDLVDSLAESMQDLGR